jgi:hypothetical protein
MDASIRFEKLRTAVPAIMGAAVRIMSHAIRVELTVES